MLSVYHVFGSFETKKERPALKKLQHPL